ncbi:hypothetical protein ACP70R_031729 [Stipagrostis hirtigluma subsp. patula]
MAHGGGEGDLASISDTGVVDDEECAGLEPFFYDEAEAVADHERRLRREQEEARKKAHGRRGSKPTGPSRIASSTTTPSRAASTSPDTASPTSASSTSTRSDESLIMTGPKRGIASIDDTYVEIDLKIKDHREQKDKELSKGYVSIRGARRQLDKYVLESRSLDTRLSTVEVMYVVVKAAVEATIAFEVLEGDFYGEITASLASFEGNSMVLHDSSKVVDVISGEGKRVIQLLRSIVAVYLEDILSLTIASQTGDGKATRTIDFTPRINGADEYEISVGVSKMRVKVSWSIIGL